MDQFVSGAHITWLVSNYCDSKLATRARELSVFIIHNYYLWVIRVAEVIT